MAREMRGVNALEGPELGALMAQAMQQRVRNNTTTAQRARSLRDMARGGPAGRAREDADIRALEEDQARFMERQRLAAEQWDALQMQERLASIGTERQPPMPNDPMNLAGGDTMWPAAPSQPQFQGQLGGTNAEEEALLAQMQADMVNQPGAQGFTSEGYVPGGAGALPQATSVPQTPQVAGSTGASQSQAGAQGFTSPGYVTGGADALPPITSTPAPPVAQPEVAAPWVDPNAPQGFTSPGYVEGGAEALPKATPVPQQPQVAGDTGTSQAQQPGPQGFTSPGYVQGEQAGAADTAGSAALQWLNELFKKDEQPPQTPQIPQGAGSNAGAQGFASPGYVSGGGQRPGESFQEFTQRQHQEKYPQQGMSPEEQQKLQQITQGLESSRPDSNADATVSWPTGTNDSGFPPIGGISGQAREVSGSEQNSAIVQSLMSELETLGIDANILRSFDIDVDKFLSGVYNMADVEKLMSLAKRAGAPASMRGRIQTMSDNVSGTSGHGFNAEGYNEGVKQKPDETFMQYTQRMHQRNKDMNQWQNPDNAWVDPDRP